ncbi:G8 domain-containing protein [uncultured Croceitalea sp.]|uniref:G8 domain-containing protein n=1 Tax=uncultured Croceitalea sp. TaxID=1798908 RepID=UPI00330612EA
MIKLFRYLSVALLITLNIHFLKAQGKSELVIPKGKMLILKKNPSPLEKITVQGVLRVADVKDIEIQVAQIVIDGGTFEIGTEQKEKKYKCQITFIHSSGTLSSGLKVINHGNLLFYNPPAIVPSIEYPSGAGKEKQLAKNIVLSTVNKTVKALIRLEKAAKVNLSGVLFKNMGDSLEPAFLWKGNKEAKASLSNSVFVNSKGDDLVLENTSARIENNIFISANGSSIICSKNGKGYQNKIESNLLINSNKKGTYALLVGNPFQSIQKNKVKVANSANGIAIKKPNPTKDRAWSTVSKFFVLSNNSIELNDSTNKEHQNIGLFIDAFNHLGIWRTTHNEILNFPVGAIIKSKNTVLFEYNFKENLVGIYPGAAYVENSRFIHSHLNPELNSKAIWATDSLGKSAPKLSNIKIRNYKTGIFYEGRIAPENYFKEIVSENTTTLGFGNLDPESIIVAKGFKEEKTENKPSQRPMTHKVNQNHHTHHTKPKKKKDYLLFHQDSPLHTNNSKPLVENAEIYQSPRDSYGTLIISTGHGLLDPVHEHSYFFNTLDLINNGTQKTISLKKPTNRTTLFTAGKNVYELKLGEEAMNFFDLSFEWESTPGNWIVLKVPYPHKKPFAMHSFGNLIDQSSSAEELMTNKRTSYFINSETIYVKLFNTKNVDELVLYSSDVLAEITLADKRVPISIKTNEEENEVLITCKTVKSTPATLELLDYYGNVVETLFDGIASKPEIKASIDLEKFDITNNVYLYSLKIDGKTHKGPIHTY